MTTRKRLDPFDVEQSGSDAESDDGYDSEAAEESKGRAVKRRKTEEESDEEEQLEESGPNPNIPPTTRPQEDVPAVGAAETNRIIIHED